MGNWRVKSRAEQVADHLREQIADGRWGSTIPGVHWLAAELGVNFKTVIEAMAILEAQGAVAPQGAGRKRTIIAAPTGKRSLKIGIFPYEMEDLAGPIDREIIHQLQGAGHHVKITSKSLCDLAMDPLRVAKMARRLEVDAWLVEAGSPEVLAWFADQDIPALAMFGRPIGLNLPSVAPRKIPAMQQAVARLVALGHTRIVLLAREERIKPVPGLFEQAFLDTLASHGIEPSRYNLPEWENRRQGYHQCLDGLFRITPPTALLVGESSLLVATLQRLAKHGITAPQRVSLVCCDPEPLFSWCDPEIAHITWDHQQVVKRVIRWVDRLVHGKEDRERVLFDAGFVEGGTIGPVPQA